MNNTMTSVFIAIRCLNIDSLMSNVYRDGCAYPEDRAAFVGKRYNLYGVDKMPIVARNPRVYRIPSRFFPDTMNPNSIKELCDDDLYAELEDVKDHKTRYAMAVKCR